MFHENFNSTDYFRHTDLLLFIHSLCLVLFSAFRHVPCYSGLVFLSTPLVTLLTFLQITIRQYIIMTTEKTSTAMLNEFHWVNVFLNVNVNVFLFLLNPVCSSRKKWHNWILFASLNYGVLFSLIHTCTPCTPASAATRQLSCVYKFHPNSSPLFLAHHDQCTGLELWIANTSFVNWF